MKFKAIIFDLDGTLLDTIEDLASSMNAVLDKLGYPTHPVDAYRYFVGEGIEFLVKLALPKEAVEEQFIYKCVNAMKEEYNRRWDQQSVPYTGIPELLDVLQQKAIPIAILSNKPDEATQMVVSKLLPNWNFQIVRGARKHIPKKPNPEAALEIAEKLKISPKDIIFVGDTKIDIETANAAGMYAVGVLWGFRDREELVESGAKVVIEKPEDILSLI